MKNVNIYWMLFVLFVFVSYLYFITPHRICNTIYKTERLDVEKNTMITYPKGTNILCEDNVTVAYNTIYGCLGLRWVDGRAYCSGEGKICLIQTKTKMCEYK